MFLMCSSNTIHTGVIPVMQWLSIPHSRLIQIFGGEYVEENV
jgi:hypothetical protein